MALTAEQRREQALAEVQQHRPAGEQAVLTLEFNHPSFDEPARVVNDNDDLDAVTEAGEHVTFVAAIFSAVGPAAGEGRWPEIEITVDMIASALEPILDQSLDEAEPVTIIAREYVRSLASDGPARVIAGLELDTTTTSDLSITGTAGFYGLDRRFGYTYDTTDYPGLR